MTIFHIRKLVLCQREDQGVFQSRWFLKRFKRFSVLICLNSYSLVLLVMDLLRLCISVTLMKVSVIFTRLSSKGLIFLGKTTTHKQLIVFELASSAQKVDMTNGGKIGCQYILHLASARATINDILNGT